LSLPIRNLVGGAIGQVPTLLTLGLLGGLAVWGAHNDWKWPQGGLKKADSDPPAPRSEEAEPLEKRLSRRIEFSSADAARVAGIEVASAEVRPMSHYVVANGMLDYEPYRYAQLAARAPGTIWRVDKVMGEAVRKGEVLALIDSAEVGRAKGDFLQSLAQVDVRTRALERLRTAGGAVAGGTLREAEDALREANIRLFNDHQRLLNLGLTVPIKEIAPLSQKEQEHRLRLLGLPQTISAAVDPDNLTANLLPLIAPFDGLVVRHPQGAPGEVVDTSKPLFVIGDTSHLHIDLDIHLEDVAHLRIGQKVTFMPEDKSGKPAEGTLAHISPEVNEKTRHVQVHAEVENPDGRLRPNTFGTGRVEISRHPEAVTVPTQAVQEVIESRTVYYFVFLRLDDTTYQARRVERGLQDAGVTEVKGVQPGEKVVTTGSHMLKSELFKDLIGGSEE
jgi:cobalt-zinc-cadmium efflux system membrane fusion protein